MRLVSLLFLDLIMVTLAAFAALLLRDNLEFSPTRIQDLEPYLFFSLLAAIIILPLAGTNRGFWHYSTFGDFLRIVLAAVVIVIAATSLTFAYNRLDGLARAIPILQLILIIGFMSALRTAVRLCHTWRARPRITKVLEAVPQAENILIVGVNSIAELFMRSAREFSRERLHVVGVLGSSDRHRGRLLHGVSILGLPDDLETVLRQLDVHGVGIQRIVVASPLSELSPAARAALRQVEDGTSIVVDYFAERIGFAPLSPREAALVLDKAETSDQRLPSLMELGRSTSFQRSYWTWKRLFDFCVAFTLIVLTAPVIGLVAIAVAIDVGHPVLFWQVRPGMLGRRIKLHKFRTMRSAHDSSGRRLSDDERLSRIGDFLRKTRLDELPQLYHILCGEMSFVGPRPLVASEQDAGHAGRLAVRPGLTGWAQVQGGRSVSVADKAALDLWYIRNASFRLDFLIALKTVRMVLLGERADESAIAQAWQDADSWRVQLGTAREVMDAPVLRGVG